MMDVASHGLMLIILMTSCLLWLLLGWQWLSLWQIEKQPFGKVPQVLCRLRLLQRQDAVFDVAMRLSRFRLLSYALCQILPLLGLLGTVNGMINVFEELALARNDKPIHFGISLALLSTFAGLVTAIPGMFFLSVLQQRKNKFLASFQKKLPIGHSMLSQER